MIAGGFPVFAVGKTLFDSWTTTLAFGTLSPFAYTAITAETHRIAEHAQPA